MIKAMCNTSPIIGLAIIGKLNLLWELFEVFIPREVYNEIVSKSPDNAFGKKELKKAVYEGNIKVHNVEDETFIDHKVGRLHKGELEVIVGAKELDIQVVIIDEKAARSFSETLMLKPIGLLWILGVE